MAHRKWLYDLREVERIYKDNKGPEAHQTLREYVESLPAFRIEKGVSKKARDKRDDGVAKAIAAANTSARKRGWIKECHNAKMTFGHWSEEKKALFKQLCEDGGMTHEEASCHPSFREDFARYKTSSVVTMGNVIKALNIDRRKWQKAQKDRQVTGKLREDLAVFLSRARTTKEIVEKFGRKVTKELANLAVNPPEGYRLKEGHNQYQEKTSWLQRVVSTREITLHPRVFTFCHSENDPDYITITFPPDLDFTQDPSMNALRIYPIDSCFFGDYLCDMDQLLQVLGHLEAKPYEFAFLNGDIIGGTNYTRNTAEKIRGEFMRRLAPVAHKILWAQSGPLEARMMKNVDGIEPLQAVCRELGIHHTSRPVRADIYWKFTRDPIEFYAIHGRSQARKDGSKANAILDVAQNQNFPHFTVMGHLKEGIIKTLTVRRLKPQTASIIEHSAELIICPGFQKFAGSEAEKKGYPPPAIGTVFCIIGADNSHKSSS